MPNGVALTADAHGDESVPLDETAQVDVEYKRHMALGSLSPAQSTPAKKLTQEAASSVARTAAKVQFGLELFITVGLIDSENCERHFSKTMKPNSCWLQVPVRGEVGGSSPATSPAFGVSRGNVEKGHDSSQPGHGHPSQLFSLVARSRNTDGSS